MPPNSDSRRATLAYYAANADEYALQTQSVVPVAEWATFCDLLPARGRVLDAGCGAGRDARAFAHAGFEVVAFDACPELAALAAQHSGVDVQVASFASFSPRSQFDGVWCSASLLHLPPAEREEVALRLVGVLKVGGLFYASFKEGDGERTDEAGRYFSDMQVQGLRGSIGRWGLELVESSVSRDVLGRRNRWVNAIGRKPAEF